jgi:hypothetical protein
LEFTTKLRDLTFAMQKLAKHPAGLEVEDAKALNGSSVLLLLI